MSKKAEEAALEAYPDIKDIVFNEEYPRILFTRYTERDAYIKGYKQAEKDLSLTIEDIENIHTFLYAIKNNKHGAFTFTRLSDEQYKEILRSFKAIKEEKK